MRRPLHVLLTSLMALTTLPAPAAEQSFIASNPGPISASTRSMIFSVSAVAGTVARAEIHLSLNFDRLESLRLRLVRNGNRFFDLESGASAATAGKRLQGVYRLTDAGVGSWRQQAEENPAALIASHFDYRATSRNGASECPISLTRIFALDIDDPNGDWELQVESDGLGSGSIDTATLILDTAPDRLFASGVEGPATPPSCWRAPFDVGANTLAAASPAPATSLSLVSNQGPFPVGDFSWRFRSDAVADYGAVLGTAGLDKIAAGSYGGQAKSYQAIWRESEGNLYFATGANLAQINLPGDFNGTQSQPIPGDYDGDGITDVAVAFKVGSNPWVARVLYSRSGDLRDYFIDPRTLSPPYPTSNLDNGRFAFGPGIDIGGDGRDEFIVLRENPAAPGFLQFIRIDPRDPFNAGLTNYGLASDRVAYGAYRARPDGAASVLTVVRINGTGLDWYLFPSFTPISFGFDTDLPTVGDFDGDGYRDIAVYRASERRYRYLASSTGLETINDALPGPALGGERPLGTVQGVLALPQQ